MIYMKKDFPKKGKYIKNNSRKNFTNKKVIVLTWAHTAQSPTVTCHFELSLRIKAGIHIVISIFLYPIFLLFACILKAIEVLQNNLNLVLSLSRRC